MADDPKPGEAVQSPAADFSQILEQAEGLATQAQSLSLAEIVAKRHAEDRGWIAKWIVGAFLTAIGIVYLIIFSAAWLGLYDWKEAVSIALEILKSVLLPVVTLILGYYFGQGAKSGG